MTTPNNPYPSDGPSAPAGPYQVWRDKQRIRRADGTGYSDRVTDDQIFAHIALAAKDKNLDQIRFSVAVLDLRQQERCAAKGSQGSSRSSSYPAPNESSGPGEST